VFMADGGGSTQDALPNYSGGQQKLHVDPSAIPQARKVFEDALGRLNDQLGDAMETLFARQWAEDPVSKETAEKFNQDTFESGDRAALQALEGYRSQLKGVIDQLTQIENTYRKVEGDNTAVWGRKH
jgi:hypothetical protein